MINPDVLGELDGDGVAVVSLDFADLHVADDDVLLAQDCEANALKSYERPCQSRRHIVATVDDTHSFQFSLR